MIIDSIFIVLAYLSGSISTAIIVCRLLGLPDPRTEGSHNPGATNVLRFGGKKAAVITLFGDLLKGYLPVSIAALAGASEFGVAGAALGAFIGHLYPVFFGFQGGKGVATAFGAILALSPWVATLTLTTWLLMAAVARTSSLAALTAAALAPFYLWWFELPESYVFVVLIMVMLLFWRHRSNIRNLLSGTEQKIGAKNKD
jgi:glycerol-3-phosphate acyltransferase PlsY